MKFLFVLTVQNKQTGSEQKPKILYVDKIHGTGKTDLQSK